VSDGFQGPPSFAGSLRGGRVSEPAAPAVADFGGDNSYLDIPAFLRRQAD
jgi:cell division protein FtsZ